MTRQWTGAALLAVAVVVAGCQGSGGGGPEGETACLGTASLVHANGRFFRYVRQRDATAIDVSDDDGATWQAGPHALKELGRPVFGNGVFFASAPSQAVEPSSFRSTDGLTWEGGDELHRGAVAFGDGLFVWVNDAGIFTSPDALAWTLRDPTKFVVEASVSFHDGLFVASGVGVAEGTETVAADSVLTSSDGLHWVASAHTLKLSSVMETLPFGGGLVVTHDDSGGDVTAFDTGFSTDFATGWRQGPELFSTGFTPFFGAVYASQSDLDGNGHVAVTTDGATWRDVADTHDFSTALAASETTLVAATSCDILTTKDGTTWAHRDAP